MFIWKASFYTYEEISVIIEDFDEDCYVGLLMQGLYYSTLDKLIEDIHIQIKNEIDFDARNAEDDEEVLFYKEKLSQYENCLAQINEQDFSDTNSQKTYSHKNNEDADTHYVYVERIKLD